MVPRPAQVSAMDRSRTSRSSSGSRCAGSRRPAASRGASVASSRALVTSHGHCSSSPSRTSAAGLATHTHAGGSHASPASRQIGTSPTSACDAGSGSGSGPRDTTCGTHTPTAAAPVSRRGAARQALVALSNWSPSALRARSVRLRRRWRATTCSPGGSVTREASRRSRASAERTTSSLTADGAARPLSQSAHVLGGTAQRSAAARMDNPSRRRASRRSVGRCTQRGWLRARPQATPAGRSVDRRPTPLPPCLSAGPGQSPRQGASRLPDAVTVRGDRAVTARRAATPVPPGRHTDQASDGASSGR